MKRTKERFGKFESYNQEGQSGLKVFDGEDLEFQDRYKLQQLQQKNWVEQQKFEKDNRFKQDRDEEKQYADQTLSINRMRGILEADHEQKRKEMNKQMMEMNKRLAEEKKNREMQSKYYETQLDMYNINEAEEKRKNVYGKMKEEIETVKSYYNNSNNRGNNQTSNSSYGNFSNTNNNENYLNSNNNDDYGNNKGSYYNNNKNEYENSNEDWKNQSNYEGN